MKSSEESEWVVKPLAKPPIDKHISEFLGKMRQSFLSNLGIPLCGNCLIELELDESDNSIYCPKCRLVI